MLERVPCGLGLGTGRACWEDAAERRAEESLCFLVRALRIAASSRLQSHFHCASRGTSGSNKEDYLQARWANCLKMLQKSSSRLLWWDLGLAFDGVTETETETSCGLRACSPPKLHVLEQRQKYICGNWHLCTPPTTGEMEGTPKHTTRRSGRFPNMSGGKTPGHPFLNQIELRVCNHHHNKWQENWIRINSSCSQVLQVLTYR